MLGWKIPERRTPDFYALSLAGTLLFEGDSSRLYQKLVKGDESVVSIEGGVDERRGPSALYIFALPKPGEEVSKIREQIFDEIKRIATDGPTDSRDGETAQLALQRCRAWPAVDDVSRATAR